MTCTSIALEITLPGCINSRISSVLSNNTIAMFPLRQNAKSTNRDRLKSWKREWADEPVGEAVKRSLSQFSVCLSQTVCSPAHRFFVSGELNRQLSGCRRSTFLHISHHISHTAALSFSLLCPFSCYWYFSQRHSKSLNSIVQNSFYHIDKTQYIKEICQLNDLSNPTFTFVKIPKLHAPFNYL